MGGSRTFHSPWALQGPSGSSVKIDPSTGAITLTPASGQSTTISSGGLSVTGLLTERFVEGSDIVQFRRTLDNLTLFEIEDTNTNTVTGRAIHLTTALPSVVLDLGLSSNGGIYLHTTGAQPIRFRTSGTGRWDINASGHVVPLGASVYDLGSTTARVRKLWVVDIDGSNVVQGVAITGTSYGVFGGGAAQSGVLRIGNNQYVTARNAAGTGDLAVIGLDTSDRIRLPQTTTWDDGKNLVFGSTTGTMIGTATTQKLAFYGAIPVVRQAALTAADASTVDATYGTEEAAVINNLRTRVNELEARLQAYGLLP